MSDRFEAFETWQERQVRESMLSDPPRLVRHYSSEALRDDILRRISDIRSLLASADCRGRGESIARDTASRMLTMAAEQVDDMFGARQ